MKRSVGLTFLVTCAFLVAYGLYRLFFPSDFGSEQLVVGFVYEEDESTPYTLNFILAQKELEKEFGGKIKVITRNNCLESETKETLEDLVLLDCGIIFVNSDSSQVLESSRKFPEVEFCQVSSERISTEDVPENYHTFNGEMYQAEYVAGVAAGMKLKSLIDSGAVSQDEALVGYVATMRGPQARSNYTAFLLGVRSMVDSATMRVRFLGSRSNFTKERSLAKALIDEGCIIVAHNTHTYGVVFSCEKEGQSRLLIHVGMNVSTIDRAPVTSLVSVRVNWAPYLIGAVRAVSTYKEIEKVVHGNVHGHDVSGGFAEGWLEISELNTNVAAYGTKKVMDQVVEDIKNGKQKVFEGDYLGMDPNGAATYDLRRGFWENESSSVPSWNYVLQDVVIEE
ncbi:MAG: BMP family ABC transporter substrate-binding protein [Blautia sp.]|nr:BMP family ABC transporter substrate-binding protein [Blautia sp.]